MRAVINTMDELKVLSSQMEKTPDRTMTASVAIELIETVQSRADGDEYTIVEYAERQETS